MKVDLENIYLGTVGSSDCYAIPAWSMKSMIAELKAARKCIELLTEQRYEFTARVDRALQQYDEATK